MTQENYLLYKSFRPDVDPATLDGIEPYVRTTIAERQGMGVAEIEAFSAREFVGKHPSSETVLRQAAHSVGLELFDADVVFCEWAAVHEDGFYRGSSFLSLVMYTGKYPYYLQTVQTRPAMDEGDGNHAFRVDKMSAVLNQGDILVFDPTVPHMAVPTRPAEGQLLVLLQWVMPTGTVEERGALKMRFAPQGKTESIRDLMSLN